MTSMKHLSNAETNYRPNLIGFIVIIFKGSVNFFNKQNQINFTFSQFDIVNFDELEMIAQNELDV